MSFKLCNDTSPPCVNGVFETAGQPNTTITASLLKLINLCEKNNHGQKSISYIAPIIWNNLRNFLKTRQNFNTYEHRVKEHFLH